MKNHTMSYYGVEISQEYFIMFSIGAMIVGLMIVLMLIEIFFTTVIGEPETIQKTKKKQQCKRIYKRPYTMSELIDKLRILGLSDGEIAEIAGYTRKNGRRDVISMLNKKCFKYEERLEALRFALINLRR